MVGYHKLRGTYGEQVDAYIALTDFAREKFVAAGLPAQKLFVEPDFVDPDPGVGHGRGGYALFVGRLSEEKGLGTLLAAWQRVGVRLPLRSWGWPPGHSGGGGGGRRASDVVGAKGARGVYELMGAATLVVVPSESFETFGRVAVEAFATGTPVLASDIGAISDSSTMAARGCYSRREIARRWRTRSLGDLPPCHLAPCAERPAPNTRPSTLPRVITGNYGDLRACAGGGR